MSKLPGNVQILLILRINERGKTMEEEICKTEHACKHGWDMMSLLDKRFMVIEYLLNNSTGIFSLGHKKQ